VTLASELGAHLQSVGCVEHHRSFFRYVYAASSVVDKTSRAVLSMVACELATGYCERGRETLRSLGVFLVYPVIVTSHTVHRVASIC
jgi:hypothetical protein